MKILVADDHRLIVEDLTDELRQLVPDAECIGTSDARQILPLFRQHRFDVVLMDIDLGGANGIQIATEILKEAPRTNIIYITGYEQYALDSYSTYASAFLVKPVSTEKLRDAMTHLRYPVSSITDDMIEAEHSGKPVIGMKIEKYREERGITRKELAELMGVSLQTVYRWENGGRIPDVMTFMRLAQVFGISADKLM